MGTCMCVHVCVCVHMYVCMCCETGCLGQKLMFINMSLFPGVLNERLNSGHSILVRYPYCRDGDAHKQGI